MLYHPRPMCPRTKSLGCYIPWTMRPLYDGSLGQHVSSHWDMTPEGAYDPKVNQIIVA
jgi:hypothetical protein